ncbi:uncharacterized protein BT62DRAFT_375447 [Guyanagaster necrorhizus]|uniref:Uncharacterized protein n=1 Tax=Guyanagaster necrorhizus TaxID=856835 RepID=A0A9P7VL00_9AGAR|nr:uncharacterized protein BT62DRAFT_375447 [Guyanagaster necrorhizus MCA 3950]KAG7442562.1 hypothetical protein BT62DRAFT_375447 [Guyanagaster necrorhizus MCA 3950]
MMYGIYTCIFLTTVWSIVSHQQKYQNKIGRKIMLAFIVALYFLGTIAVAVNWAFTRYCFITHGQNFWTVFSTFNNISTVKQKASTFFLVESVATGVTGGLQNVIADLCVIWRCWTVWGYRWPVVFVPILCTIGAAISKGFQEYIEITELLNVHNPENFKPSSVDWTMAYISLSLAVTLMCTILIVLRIITVGRANRKTIFGSYRAIVEIVIESAALLSIILIIYMVTYARGAYAAIYVDSIAANIRGIAPTLIVGRVASGHSRPDETWEGSAISSLHFGTRNHTRTHINTLYNDQRNTTVALEDNSPDVDPQIDSAEDPKPGTEIA